MYWILKNYERDFPIVVNLRVVPFYTKQGHTKKGGRRKY